MTEAEELRQRLANQQRAFQSRKTTEVEILRKRPPKQKSEDTVAIFPAEAGADQLLKLAEANHKTSTKLVAALKGFIDSRPKRK